MVQIVYLLLFMPFEEKLVGRLELFNEYTAMVLLYHAFMFTSLVPSYYLQRMAGFSFLLYMILNISVHFFFLFKTTFFDCKKKCKKRLKKWKKKEKKKRKKEYEEKNGEEG